MAHNGWMTVACLALTFLWACGGKETPSNPPSGPAAAVQSNEYKGTGVVKALNLKAPAIEIDHGDIDGLMPAMQMEFPVSDPALLNGLAVNDRIDFTLEGHEGQLKVIAIKKK